LTFGNLNSAPFYISFTVSVFIFIGLYSAPSEHLQFQSVPLFTYDQCSLQYGLGIGNNIIGY